MQIRIRRGLAFPSAPVLEGETVPAVGGVAVHADEHAGLKPSLNVKAGDRVEAGQALFCDRSDPDIRFVTPVDGQVTAIHMAARRRLVSVVIAVDDPAAPEREVTEPVKGFDELAALPLKRIRALLLESGLWPAIRQRPGDCLAPSMAQPDALLITAIDTEPWAPDPQRLLADQWEAFWLGAAALARIARQAAWVCVAPGFPAPPAQLEGLVRMAVFSGPHPAGLVGTHLGRLAPLGMGRRAWHAGSQDVAAIGRLLSTGRLPATRCFGVVGPGIDSPMLCRLPLGAGVSDLLPGPGSDLVCGSVLAGRPAIEPFEHLGRFHRQVTVLPRGQSGFGDRGRFFQAGGFIRLHPGHARPLAGGMLPHDGLDRRWAQATPPAPLLRAMMTGDYERAAALGCLDLGEEDLALASLICPGGHDYGAYLRKALDELAGESGP